MPFRFKCENCDVRIKVPDGSEGKKVKCPSCGQAQRVPGEAVTAAAVAATQPARPAAKQPVAATSATPPKAAAKIATTPSSEAKTTPAAKAKREASRPAPPAAPVKAAEPDDALAALAAAAGADAPTEPTPVRRQSTRPIAAEPVSAPEPAPTLIDTTTEPAVASPPADESVISDVPAAANPVDEPIEDHQALQAFLAATEPVVQAVPPASEFVAPPDVPHETTSSQAAEVISHADAPPVESAEPETTLADAATSAQEPIELNEASLPPSSPMSASMDALFGTAPTATAASLADQPTEPDAASSESQGEDEESGITRSISASEVGEAPAGEVRDLFDDFVRKETIVREAESQAKTSHEVASMEPAPSASSVKPTTATRAAARAVATPQTPAEPSPVVVVKTPLRVVRGGAAAAKAAPAVVPVEPVIEPAGAQADAEADSLAVAAAAMQARRAPVAIPLSSAAPAVAVIPPVDAATFAEPAAAEPMMAVPVAKPRRTAPAPAYSLLIVLCWALRLLACLSLVSVVKLTLMALDADYKPVDVAIIAPLGVGISAAIWAVGEVARVARDAARNSHR